MDPKFKGQKHEIQGAIQKGPFISGSSITIQELDDNLAPTGNTYTTKTTNDFGHYEPGSQIASAYVEIIASGFYFDEVKGSLSSANLTLRAIGDLTANDTINVNILTTLSVDRIKSLVKNSQKTFEEAQEQAESEILNIFNITEEDMLCFDQMDISQNGNSNAALLAISAILQGSNTVAQLSELLSKINQDIQSDGSLDDQKYKDEISTNAKEISLTQVRQNVVNRYSDLGLSIEVPTFEGYVNVVWENSPPTCSITTPANASQVTRGDTVTTTVTATDVDGAVAKVEFYLDNILKYTATAMPYVYNWNTSGHDLKQYNIKAIAYDDDNDTTSSQISVDLVTAKPNCSITAPQDQAQFTRENTISIKAEASDSDGTIASVAFYIDDVLSQTDTESPFVCDWNPGGVASGTHKIKIIAKDSDNAEAMDSIHVNIDYIPPIVAITAPQPGSTHTTENVITISATASDNDGSIESVGFYLDNALLGTDTEAPYTYNWNANGVSAGSHTLKAIAKDNDNNETATSIQVNIVYHAPACQIVSPVNGSSHTTNTPITITVDASDSDGNIESVSFYLDNNLLNTDTAAPYTYDWNANGVSAGPHTLKAIAKDNDNNETPHEITVTIQYNAPTCQITAPQTGSAHTTDTPITITADASDSDGNIESVSFYLDNNLLNTDTAAPYTYDWNANGVSAGSHTLKAVALDNDNNETSHEIEVTIQYNAPTCQITAPQNNSSYDKLSTISIAVNATDSDGSVTSVEFYIDNTLVSTDTNAPYGYTWNPANSSAGQHTIKAVATDNHGNTTEHQINVNIQAIAPTCQIITPQSDSTFIAGDDVLFKVNATDTDGTIQSVAFYVNNALKSTDTQAQAPFEYTWNTTGASAGNHAIRVVATDDDGQTAQDELNLSYVGSVTLSSPATGLITNDRTPTFQWQANNLATSYQFVLSTNADLSNPVLTQTGVATNEFTLQTNLPLTPSTQYYWAVTPVDVNGGIGSASSTWDFTLDTSAPTGSVVINDDDEKTSEESVNLTISASDQHNVTQMYISKDGSFTDGSWENYAISKVVEFSEYANTENVTLSIFIKFRDSLGNESNIYTDAIELVRKFVSGTYWSDVTWTKNETPHILTGNVQIPNGVTLTIEPGVEVYYPNQFQILVKGGTIVANGTEAEQIILNQDLSINNVTMILFESTNLSNTQISYININNAYRGIKVGNESEHNQSSPKNSGTLTLSNIKLINTELRTDGYDSQANVVLESATINNSRIFGEYPRSEIIEINNSTINNSILTSDSYNKGIIINTSTADNCVFRLGCCGANFMIYSSSIVASEFNHYNDYNEIGIYNSNLNNVDINLPYAISTIEDCIIKNSKRILVSYSVIRNSKIEGTNQGRGLEFTSYRNGNTLIENCTISNFENGIYVQSITDMEINNTNMSNNSTYNIYNNSNKTINAKNNYWGTDDETVIKQKIFDYYDNINKGEVVYSPFEITQIEH